MSYLDIVSDANNLYDAFKKVKKSSPWKTSTQRCELNILKIINNLQNNLRNNTYKQQPYTEFIIRERDKIRPIRAQHAVDKIVQHSLCDNVLIPILRKKLIHDNGASLEGKGIQFSRDRIKVHLRKYLRDHSDGYILLIDFRKFFDNIPHNLFLERVQNCLNNDYSLEPILKHILESFCANMSYMTDEEWDNIDNFVFNSFEYRQNRKISDNTNSKILHRSLGIGSQISQIGGVFYPTYIDNYFKTVLGIKYYGRYMDDVYIIHENKEYLKELCDIFCTKANDLHMFINKKKTQIRRLTHGFTFLKMHYKVKDKYIKIAADNSLFIRERRRLKKLKKKCDDNVISFETILNCYKSWRGTVQRYANKPLNLQYTDDLFVDLFYKHLNKEVA